MFCLVLTSINMRSALTSVSWSLYHFFIICLPAMASPSPTRPPIATTAPPATAIPIIPSFSSLFVTIASSS